MTDMEDATAQFNTVLARIQKYGGTPQSTVRQRDFLAIAQAMSAFQAAYADDIRTMTEGVVTLESNFARLAQMLIDAGVLPADQLKGHD